MADRGSKLESEEEPVLFTNTEQPLEDPTIAAVEMKVRMRKKDVTSCVTKIETVRIIQKAATGGSSSGNNMVVIGYITAGADHIKKSQECTRATRETGRQT
jgi:hypothetical protein